MTIPDRVTPEKISQANWAFAQTMTLRTAVELKLFSAVAKGARDVPALAKACAASERGVRMLVEALTAMEFLMKGPGGIELAPVSQKYLVEGKDAYFGDLLGFGAEALKDWLDLTQIVRAGRCVGEGVDDEKVAREFFPRLAAALFNWNYPLGILAANQLGLGNTWLGIRVLDLACGACPWSVPMAERDPNLKVTAVDFPEILEVAKTHAGKYFLLDQYEFKAGNLRTLDLGEGTHDLAVLGHILHSEGPEPSRALLKKVARALKPKGKILIAEFCPDDARTGPLMPLLFALNMLVATSEGDVFTVPQLAGWLKEAGFGEPKRLECPPPVTLLVAEVGAG